MKPILLLVALLFTLPARGQEVQATTPPDRVAGLEAGGFRLGRLLLRELEERTIQLRPGPVQVTNWNVPALAPVCRGLDLALSPRGFSCHQNPDSSCLRLVLAGPTGGEERRLTLSAPQLGAGPWTVVVHSAPWVVGPPPVGEALRTVGGWQPSRDEAVEQVRRAARSEVLARIAEQLPWRPWTRTHLDRLLPAGDLEEGLFVECLTTSRGALWRGWLLSQWDGEGLSGIQARMAREDGRWFRCIGLSLLAALLLWGASWRLDWATRGFFSRRIRGAAFLAWVGLCALLVIVI